MAGLLEKLHESCRERRDTALIFRIPEQSVEEMEDRALDLIKGLPGHERCPKSRVRRRRGRSEILLPDGGKAAVFHASGAFQFSAGIPPMEQLMGREADRDRLQRFAEDAARRLRLFDLAQAEEKLAFEKLWLIKAAGMDREGNRGAPVVCRAVGAFRREIAGLPVWGRASAFVELAGSDTISAVGVDWRPVHPRAVDEVKLIEPERAARAIVGDLNGRLPGGFDEKAFEVTMFSLGYMSLPKRRQQGSFAPVYVALIERRGWSSMNYVVTVNASEDVHETLCRTASRPPADAIKRRVPREAR